MDPLLIVLLIVTLAALAGVGVALRRGNGDTAGIGQAARELAQGQAQLEGRLEQMAVAEAAAQARLAEHMQAQERQLARMLEERLAEVSRKLGESLDKAGTQTNTTIDGLRERLAVIDAAQKNITELSARVVALQDILSNKQARGAFGELQLEDLVRDVLPPSAYSFQAALGDGRRVDCLLHLPNPPGAIAVDAKFPLESYRALMAAGDDAQRALARKALGVSLTKHINDIADRYIVAGETAESALMFLPSEAVYAELHANLAEIVDASRRKRVWIVSPTTMMATLTTIRAVLKDARMREQAHLIQDEVRKLMEDVARLDKRTETLQTHFEQASKDVREIRISAEKVTKRAESIEQVELGGAVGAAGAPIAAPSAAAEPVELSFGRTRAGGAQ
ncbi:MAG: DNA recombination protein RmuC [Alphaproteobacteria bacterium]|nr:DNA recombination protein RmuC [Alphaproteobacteria bacterium]